VTREQHSEKSAVLRYVRPRPAALDACRRRVRRPIVELAVESCAALGDGDAGGVS